MAPDTPITSPGGVMRAIRQTRLGGPEVLELSRNLSPPGSSHLHGLTFTASAYRALGAGGSATCYSARPPGAEDVAPRTRGPCRNAGMSSSVVPACCCTWPRRASRITERKGWPWPWY